MVHLIGYSQFGRLRLADFAPPGEEVTEFVNWEFMDDLWIGEALGAFTKFLRLEQDPEVVRAITIDLAELPREIAAAILGAIGLPLEPRSSEAAVRATLGLPDFAEQFVSAPDRRTLNYTCGGGEPYFVSCTMHETDGLIYVVVMAPTPWRLAADGTGPPASSECD